MKTVYYALAVVAGIAALGALDWLGRKAPAPPVRQVEQPAPETAQFRKWAVLIVAGDNRAHSGAPSQVFDDARRDLTKAFEKIGFAKDNILQFSLNYDDGVRPTSMPAIAGDFHDLSRSAADGCLVYFTSHGTPDGIIVGNDLLGPSAMAQMVNDSCGQKPAVIVISSCFSGQFVPGLMAPNRIVMTAARADRTSFGCGELNQYTFFDDCFLRALDKSSDFGGLGDLVQQCVRFREEQLKATPPSQPQLAVGPNVAFTLRWK